MGGYWTRTNVPEIDIVIADKAPVANQILAVGSVKWLDNDAFDAQDLGELLRHRAQLPGADDDTPLVVISRSGCTVDGVLHFGPQDLIGAYSHG